MSALQEQKKLEVVCRDIVENGGSSIAVQADITDKTRDRIINVAIEKYKIDALIVMLE